MKSVVLLLLLGCAALAQADAGWLLVVRRYGDPDEITRNLMRAECEAARAQAERDGELVFSSAPAEHQALALLEVEALRDPATRQAPRQEQILADIYERQQRHDDRSICQPRPDVPVPQYCIDEKNAPGQVQIPAHTFRSAHCFPAARN